MIKKYFIIVSLTFYFGTGFSQDIHYEYYTECYDTIVNTPIYKDFLNHRKANVSSQTVPMPVIGRSFYTELNKFGILNNTSLQSIGTKEFRSDKMMDNIFKRKKYAKTNIFFSEITQDFIVIEITRSLKKTNDYKYATQYGKSLCFLIRFNEKGNIILVKSKYMHNN